MPTASRDRLSRYARLASVAGIGSAGGLGSTALGSTYDFSGSTPQSVSITFGSFGSSSAAAFRMGTAAGTQGGPVGIPINFFVSGGSGNPASYYWGFKIPTSFRSNFGGGPAGEPKWVLGGSQSITVSAGMQANTATWALYNTSQLSGAPTTGYLGFSIEDQVAGDTYNGFLQYTFTLTAGAAELTIGQWAYNVNTPITMPPNGATAVPGFGGLAALACGAAGVRRSRRRFA